MCITPAATAFGLVSDQSIGADNPVKTGPSLYRDPSLSETHSEEFLSRVAVKN